VISSEERSERTTVIAGRMVYPRGRDEFVWDGRSVGGIGPALRIASEGIELTPGSFMRWVKFPDVFIPYSKIRSIEKMLLWGVVFRTVDPLTDGASFTPSTIRTHELILLLEERGCRFVETTFVDQLLWRLRHIRSNLFPRGERQVDNDQPLDEDGDPRPGANEK
jgi:hypothetical protein